MIGKIGTLGLQAKELKNSNIKNNSNGLSFSEVLKKSIGEVNNFQKNSEKAMTDIATGQVKDLHQAAIAIDKAEISMKTMLEVRNKALSAYKEILRTQI
jgi:flagellar hook-basal body complex protein FliE